MDLVGQHVFFIARAWIVAVFCFAISGANLYKSFKSHVKKWPRRLKAVNWFVLGGVYVYMETQHFSATDTDLLARILTNVAISFLIFGEAAYHADVFQDMIDSAIGLAKRLVRHG